MYFGGSSVPFSRQYHCGVSGYDVPVLLCKKRLEWSGVEWSDPHVSKIVGAQLGGIADGIPGIPSNNGVRIYSE
jgi:hypothetical protein